MLKPNSQKDYTSLGENYQLFLPLTLEFQVSKDDPVRLLRHCIGGMDIKSLEKTYHRIDRNLALPRQMLAVLVYAGMNHIFSSRRIETACRRDINFMYLLEGKPAPDHATISRFRSKHLAPCIKELFAQMDFLLEQFGVISLKNIFIDGTKIESFSNKYKFVWKKTVLKNKAKLMEKIPAFVSNAREEIASNVKRKVAGYARVSTDTDDQISSYAAQVDYYTRYIKERKDWEFVGMYTDEGVMGTSTKKCEGFTRMIKDALEGKIQLIITSIKTLYLIQSHFLVQSSKSLAVKGFGDFAFGECKAS